MRSPDWYSGTIFLGYVVVVAALLYTYNYVRNIARRERRPRIVDRRVPGRRAATRPVSRGGRTF